MVRQSRQQGFTLVEIAIVLVIIGLLLACAEKARR
jgi:prepilin-type N-terminal cleavage/methylation domain-containing protein